MKQAIIDKIKSATQSFALISLLWLMFMILLSIYEVLVNGISHQFFKDTITALGANVINTISFWLKCNLILYFLFLAFYFISSKLSSWFFYTLSTLLLLIQIGLIQYSVIAMVPLGADFFNYSAADMKQTVGAAGGISFSMILTFILFLCAYVFMLYKFRKQNNMQPKIAAAFPLLSIVFVFSSFSSSNTYLSLKKEYSRNLALNNPIFSLSNLINIFFQQLLKKIFIPIAILVSLALVKRKQQILFTLMNRNILSYILTQLRMYCLHFSRKAISHLTLLLF